MSDYVDPVTGKRPCEMNIVEWCDWEIRARQEWYEVKYQARKAQKAERRNARVEWIKHLLDELEGVDHQLLAERIDQAQHPEAWGLRYHGGARV